MHTMVASSPIISGFYLKDIWKILEGIQQLALTNSKYQNLNLLAQG